MSRRRSPSQAAENIAWHENLRRQREEAARKVEEQRARMPIPGGLRRVTLDEIFDELPVVSGY